ncbi:MAG: hypothetical protein OEV74_06985 [Cyclobacteriaceae bacterium]|nr:hypothetical protein [Cyclobacteriaceae bacterium]MDH4296005.1 hypothetical protein [Cyclobacteriaceae bacterium]MDH5248468.1 hypothetical protein [Cyclobacteriaceae bacterium]
MIVIPLVGYNFVIEVNKKWMHADDGKNIQMFFVVLDVYRLVKLTEHRQAPSAGSSRKGWGFSLYTGLMVKFMPYPVIKPAIPGKRSIFAFSFSGLSDNNSLPAYATGMGKRDGNQKSWWLQGAPGAFALKFYGKIYSLRKKEIWLN